MLKLAMLIGSIAFCASCSLVLGVVLNAAISSLSYNQVLLSLVRPVLSVMDLHSLNKSSAKVADFPVTMSMGKITEYSYTSKKDCSTVKAQKFEVYVLGTQTTAVVSTCSQFLQGACVESARRATTADASDAGARADAAAATDADAAATDADADAAKADATRRN